MANITFNGIAIPNFIKVTGITTQALPDLENRTRKAPRLIGLHDTGTTLGGKKIKIDFTMLNEGKYTTQDKQEIIAEWLRGNDFKASKLVLPDYPNSYYLAKINNPVEVSDSLYFGSGSMEFILLNPNRIDTTPSTVISQLETFYILYTGTTETPPIISLKATTTTTAMQINFLNDKYSNFLRVLGNFTTGDIVKIDMNTKKVTLNNNINMPLLTLNSGFHKLLKGYNYYSNEYPSATEVTVIYNNEYL